MAPRLTTDPGPVVAPAPGSHVQGGHEPIPSSWTGTPQQWHSLPEATQLEWIKVMKGFHTNTMDRIGRKVTSAVEAPAKAAEALPKLVDFITNGQTWVRVGEITAGLILLAIGIDHMFNMGLANKAAKAALL